MLSLVNTLFTVQFSLERFNLESAVESRKLDQDIGVQLFRAYLKFLDLRALEQLERSRRKAHPTLKARQHIKIQ